MIDARRAFKRDYIEHKKDQIECSIEKVTSKDGLSIEDYGKENGVLDFRWTSVIE